MTKLVLALDVDKKRKALSLVRQTKDHVDLYKIGSELFTAEGPGAIAAILNEDVKVFLDLKFHDIPNTVAKAVRSAVRLGVSMLNVHITGGRDMLVAALYAAQDEAVKRNCDRPLILGVTILTSIDVEAFKKIYRFKDTQIVILERLVAHLSNLAHSYGLDGVICSPKEIISIKTSCRSDFKVITPGVRPAWYGASDDQKRVMTPGEAASVGADYIVVGRPILRSDSPYDSARKIKKELRLNEV